MSVVSLEKGQKVSLEKAAGKSIDRIAVALGWQANGFDGNDFDLDASLFLLDDSKKCQKSSDFVFYGNDKNENGSVQHTGDNLTGKGDGDDETIYIDLAKLPAHVERIAVAVTIHKAAERNQNFGQVEDAYVRMYDRDNGDKEFLRYDLTDDYSLETALVFAELYKKNGEWRFDAVGQGFANGLAGLCDRYGIQHS